LVLKRSIILSSCLCAAICTADPDPGNPAAPAATNNPSLAGGETSAVTTVTVQELVAEALKSFRPKPAENPPGCWSTPN
jgi:hypothetical protein